MLFDYSGVYSSLQGSVKGYTVLLTPEVDLVEPFWLNLAVKKVIIDEHTDDTQPPAEAEVQATAPGTQPSTRSYSRDPRDSSSSGVSSTVPCEIKNVYNYETSGESVGGGIKHSTIYAEVFLLGEDIRLV
ncbi:hypothetical protein Hamer_G000712 [Homarus americanus]|uniref:Uncharacterized protein n=1 Tax=Homarus americanus TaxID=6706 RepID=A0A8J5TC42_HOMAM|nr:hypothetical protein Hamer_G000712 [Homarus americanus]